MSISRSSCMPGEGGSNGVTMPCCLSFVLMYIDPGSGFMVLWMLFAALMGFVFRFRNFLRSMLKRLWQKR